MKRNRMAAIGLLLAMTCPRRTALAAGDNLVPNGNFDTDLSDWTGNRGGCSMYGGLCWSREDAVGSPTSGSAVLGASVFTEVAMTLRSSCIPVTGGDDYTFGVAAKFRWFYFPHDPDAYTTATLVWFNNPKCQSSLSGNELRILSNSWKTTQQAVTAPVDAVAAYVVLLAQVSIIAKFDNVRLIHVASSGSTTTTTLACEGACGDPVSDTTAGLVTSSDALYMLQAAVGELTCPRCICDVNDSGDISATDALLTLAASVGGPVPLVCPQ